MIWHVLTRDHTVLPAIHTFIHKWNEPHLLFASRRWASQPFGRYSLTIQLRVGGWVGLGDRIWDPSQLKWACPVVGWCTCSGWWCWCQDDEKCLSDEDGPSSTSASTPLRRLNSQPFLAVAPPTQKHRRPSLPSAQTAPPLPPKSRQLPPPPLDEEGYESTRDAAKQRYGVQVLPPPTPPIDGRPKLSLFQPGRRS